MDDGSGFRSDQKNKLSVARYPSYRVAIISMGRSDKEEMTVAFTPRFLRPCTNNYDLPGGDKKLCCCLMLVLVVHDDQSLVA